MSTPVIYQLKVPIVWGSETITELKFKAPKYKHLKVIDRAEGGMEVMGLLLEKLCDLTPPQVDEIDPQDIMGIQEILKTFLPQSPETPSNS